MHTPCRAPVNCLPSPKANTTTNPSTTETPARPQLSPVLSIAPSTSHSPSSSAQTSCDPTTTGLPQTPLRYTPVLSLITDTCIAALYTTHTHTFAVRPYAPRAGVHTGNAIITHTHTHTHVTTLVTTPTAVVVQLVKPAHRLLTPSPKAQTTMGCQ